MARTCVETLELVPVANAGLCDVNPRPRKPDNEIAGSATAHDSEVGCVTPSAHHVLRADRRLIIDIFFKNLF
jgi:hypothetical protein